MSKERKLSNLRMVLQPELNQLLKTYQNETATNCQTLFDFLFFKAYQFLNERDLFFFAPACSLAELRFWLFLNSNINIFPVNICVFLGNQFIGRSMAIQKNTFGEDTLLITEGIAAGMICEPEENDRCKIIRPLLPESMVDEEGQLSSDYANYSIISIIEILLTKKIPLSENDFIKNIYLMSAIVDLLNN